MINRKVFIVFSMLAFLVGCQNGISSNDSQLVPTDSFVSESEQGDSSTSSGQETTDTSSTTNNSSTEKETLIWPSAESVQKEAKKMTIEEILVESKKIPINDKGSSYSTSGSNPTRSFSIVEDIEPIKVCFQGQYIDKSEKKNPVFYADGKVLQVYCIDNDKVENLLDTSSCIGNVYEVTGYMTMYKFKPSIMILKTYQEELTECSFVKKSNAIVTNQPNLDDGKKVSTSITDLRKVKPDQIASFESYTKIYHFEGYVNVWQQGKDYLMLVDDLTINCDPFKANFNAVRVNNFDTDAYTKLENYFYLDQQVTFDYYVFQWFNMNKQPIYEIEIINSSLIAIPD